MSKQQLDGTTVNLLELPNGLYTRVVELKNGQNIVNIGTADELGETIVPWLSWKEYPKTSIDGAEYAVIGDRYYPQHAVDRTLPSSLNIGKDTGRSVSPQWIEDMITSPNSTRTFTERLHKGKIELRTEIHSGSLKVVTTRDEKIVISVYSN